MYNILELKDKDLDELQSIAREMSLESTSFSNKDELVYAILDQQAINMAEKRNAVKESQVASKRSEKSFTKAPDTDLSESKPEKPARGRKPKVKEPEEAIPAVTDNAVVEDTPVEPVVKPRRVRFTHPALTDQVEITYPESTVPVESAVAEPEKKKRFLPNKKSLRRPSREDAAPRYRN